MLLTCFILILILNLPAISANLFQDLVDHLIIPSLNRTNEKFNLTHAENYARTTPPEMIKKENYPSETHYVTTADGYILTVHRIPGPPGSTPIFLQHGLLESSADWLLRGKKNSLAYILSDHGYDVWLGNARGNTYSKMHTDLSKSDPKFWDFSWEELGKYDLPAVITYITDLKQNSLFYIGHSMGATTFTVVAIEKPEVAKKVRAIIALAPATHIYHTRAAVKLLCSFLEGIPGSHKIARRDFTPIQIALYFPEYSKFAESIIYEFLPRSQFSNDFAKNVWCN